MCLGCSRSGIQFGLPLVQPMNDLADGNGCPLSPVVSSSRLPHNGGEAIASRRFRAGRVCEEASEMALAIRFMRQCRARTNVENRACISSFRISGSKGLRA